MGLSLGTMIDPLGVGKHLEGGSAGGSSNTHMNSAQVNALIGGGALSVGAQRTAGQDQFINAIAKSSRVPQTRARPSTGEVSTAFGSRRGWNPIAPQPSVLGMAHYGADGSVLSYSAGSSLAGGQQPFMQHYTNALQQHFGAGSG